MKKYFVLEHAGNIIMLDVKDITINEDMIAINTDDDAPEDYHKIQYFHHITYGNFLGVIKVRRKNISKRGETPVYTPSWKYEPNPEGGFICFDAYDDNNVYESYRETGIDLFLNKNIENNCFIELQDDDAARLWIEAMRQEYTVRGEEKW